MEISTNVTTMPAKNYQVSLTSMIADKIDTNNLPDFLKIDCLFIMGTRWFSNDLMQKNDFE